MGPGSPWTGTDTCWRPWCAPACLNGDDDVEKILLGCWIEGRPGRPTREGFNSLVDYRSITPPPLWTPSGSPPVATPGPVPETDAPPRPDARNPLRDARPLDSPPEQDDFEPDVPERVLGTRALPQCEAPLGRYPPRPHLEQQGRGGLCPPGAESGDDPVGL